MAKQFYTFDRIAKTADGSGSLACIIDVASIRQGHVVYYLTANKINGVPRVAPHDTGHGLAGYLLEEEARQLREIVLSEGLTPDALIFIQLHKFSENATVIIDVSRDAPLQTVLPCSQADKERYCWGNPKVMDMCRDLASSGGGRVLIRKPDDTICFCICE